MSYLSGQSRVRPAAVIIAALIAVQSLGAAVSHPFRTPASSSATKTVTPGPTARPKPDATNHATNNQTSLGFIRNSGLAAPAVRYFAQAAGAGFYFEASRAGAKTFSVTARDAAANTATQSVSYTVGFRVRSIPSAMLSVKRGSPVPVAIQLTDAANANVSSASVLVTVRGLRAVSSGAVLPLKDSAWLNPDHNFRFALGAYGYALGTKALTPGIYELQFTAANDPVMHTLQVRVVK